MEGSWGRGGTRGDMQDEHGDTAMALVVCLRRGHLFTVHTELSVSAVCSMEHYDAPQQGAFCVCLLGAIATH